MLQALLTLIYGTLIWPARLWAGLMGRDPLQTKLRPEQASFWLPLPPRPGTQSFYSEGSDFEPASAATARWAKAALLWIGGCCAPKSAGGRVTVQPLDDAIPDEIYTLW